MTDPRTPSRVALITGASTGLGETIAEFLGGAGFGDWCSPRGPSPT